MKSIFLILSLCSLVITNSNKTESDLDEISKVVHAFSFSADQQDVKKMDQVLHENFRAVVNRLFGGDEVSIMNKTVYLDLLNQKKIGGDKRTVEIHSIHLSGNNAIVQCAFTGKALTFETFIQLVKTPDNNWLVIGDMPHIEKVTSE